jgi:hypothetical protein
MNSTTCEVHIDALADWVDMTYTGKKDFNIVARIATLEERNRWAISVLSAHKRSPEFQKLMANLVDENKRSDAERYSALREAFLCLARSSKYKARVDRYVASLSSRNGFLSTMLNPEFHIEGAVAAV